MGSDRSSVVSSRKAHWFALTSGILYFSVVAGLILTVILDPDGGVTGGAPGLLTLPWSIFAEWVKASESVAVALILFFATINAATLYVVVRKVLRVVSIRTTSVALVTLAIFTTVVVWFFNSQSRDFRVRIINGARNGAGETGAFVAIDQEGLRAMSAKDSLASPPPEPGRHLVYIPNQTRGIYKGRRFLLKGGRLVEPYPANGIEMKRDGMVEVEKIRITEGPYKGLEGWIQTQNLQRLLTMFAI